MASPTPQARLATTVPRSVTAVDQPVASDQLDDLGPDLARSARLAGFEGKVGQTMVVPGPANEPIRILVGIGPADELSVGVLRRAAAAAARQVTRHQAVATTLAEEVGAVDGAAAIAAVVEGYRLAAYRYEEFKTHPDVALRRVTVIARGRGMRAALDRANGIVDGAVFARDLASAPGGTLLPAVFADRLVEMASEQGLEAEVWELDRLEAEKFGGVLAVNRGSTNPPRFVILRYRPEGKPTGDLAFVGKGITFDAGGLSIKTAAGMMTMKIDMGGAAAVAGAMAALRPGGCRAAVTAYIPMTDNMLGGDATRPGDVFTARNGKTVEVLNTDAEGRLILADALSYAVEQQHDLIVDIATLTGSASAALGTGMAALMGRDEELLASVEASAASTGEKVWRLPLPSEYRKQLDSVVADMKNIGNGPYGGALIAGLFLAEFAGDGPWAHIDLGLSAIADGDDGVIVKGATGFGARLLTDLALNWRA